VYADKHLLVTRTVAPPGLRFAGEMDMTNSEAVMNGLKITFPHNGDHHLDLSALSFCDISGIRALIEIATELGDGRRLLLHGLPDQLQTVLRVTGWSDLPNLAICTCGARAV
jgi:anti-anti-sigma factor